MGSELTNVLLDVLLHWSLAHLESEYENPYAELYSITNLLATTKERKQVISFLRDLIPNEICPNCFEKMDVQYKSDYKAIQDDSDVLICHNCSLVKII